MNVVRPAYYSADDEAKKYFELAGPLEDIEVFNNQVLVAVYIRPEKTAGGILLHDMTKTEDRFQSKAGVILKMGPSAFLDDNGQWFQGVKFNAGDWVIYRVSDGWSLELHRRDKNNAPVKVLCRLLDDIAIRARISHPQRVY